MWAWQFMEYNMVARLHGWTEFISMQNFYAASYRNEEQEMLPCCKKLGVGVIPWSPLAVSLCSGLREQSADCAIGWVVDEAS
jgi:aryl-alcohol dehydrogenase-like predicted oxidoreductase